MGNCLHSAAPLSTSVTYPCEYQLTFPSRHKKVKVRLQRPAKLEAGTLKAGRVMVTATGCVVAGMNVVGGVELQTQEVVFKLGAEEGVLAGVLDGHGREGSKVVNFCSEWFQSYFKQHWQDFRADPTTALQQTFERCDAALKLEIDCVLSGSSAVLIYLTENTATVANVGSSTKAVLATITTGSQSQAAVLPSSDPFRRSIVPTRSVAAVEVSLSLPMNSEEECQRIQRCNGRVMRIAADKGGKVGPYRVWQQAHSLPGLASSRSLGDKMASELGVISTPLVRHFPLQHQSDLFFILASDGLWHMLSSQESVDYVEKFRHQASKSVPPAVVYPVRVHGTTVSHLLCEEARLRWLGVAQREEVSMDDISCLVLELAGSLKPSEISSSRFDSPPCSLSSVDEGHGLIYAPTGADPLRNSLIPVHSSEKRISVVRKDAKRGSVAQGVNT